MPKSKKRKVSTAAAIAPAKVYQILWEVTSTIVLFGEDAFAECGEGKLDSTERRYRQEIEGHVLGSSNVVYSTTWKANAAATKKFAELKAELPREFDVVGSELDEDDEREPSASRFTIRPDTTGKTSMTWNYLTLFDDPDCTVKHHGYVRIKTLRVV